MSQFETRARRLKSATRTLSAAIIVTLVAVAFAAAKSTDAAEPTQPGAWGSVAGRVFFKGDLSAAQVKQYRDDVNIYERTTIPRPGQPARVPNVLATVRNQTLLVDSKTGGLKNAFVYLRNKPDSIHPPDPERPAEPLEVVNRDYHFWPRDLIAQVGQTVRLRTEKEVTNFKAELIKNQEFNTLVSPSKPFEWKPIVVEPIPVRVSSNLHPYAISYWLVVDHPYAALTAADGTFRLDNLPAGEHEIFVWHETVGWVAKKLKVDVKADAVTELPPVILTADRLKK